MPSWLNTSILTLTQLIVLIGLFGLIVPVFPGIVVIWLAVLGYGVIKGFSTVGFISFVIISVLMLLGTVVDNILMGTGARRGGTSWLAIGFGLVAGVNGTLIYPPLGGIIAAPLVVFLFEYLRRKDLRKAWNALRGLATGWGLSLLVRFGIGFLMMVLWWIWVKWG